MDYTQIISAVIALISALVSAFLIPWLKTKIDADKLQTLRTYVPVGDIQLPPGLVAGLLVAACCEIPRREGHSI